VPLITLVAVISEGLPLTPSELSELHPIIIKVVNTAVTNDKVFAFIISPCSNPKSYISPTALAASV
jgi:hypothetical protein